MTVIALRISFAEAVVYQDREISALVAELTKASAILERGDARVDQLESAVNSLLLAANRPRYGGDGYDGDERKSAAEMCVVRKSVSEPKDTTGTRAAEYHPGSGEIDDAIRATKALRSILRHGDPSRLEPEFRKSLTSFSFGANAYLMPIEMSSRVLRCIVDPTDLAGLVSNEQISGSAIRFPIDNSRMNLASWACEANCFANNPSPDLQDGLGELEVKAESIRFIACAGKDLLEDSGFNFEPWLLRRAEAGYREAISAAIILGDGVGKPLGLLRSIPICETSASTGVGSISWQDLVLLKFEVPMQWHAGAVYLMNSRTFAQVMTMSDAMQRPIWTEMPGKEPGFMLAGSPVVIATQMPDIAPGSTPVFYGNLKECYTLVTRRGLTLQPDPYTAQWCMLYRFDARIGGAPLCPNAGRLLRVR